MSRLVRAALLSLAALVMLIPGYLLVVNAFKGQDDILHSPFGIPFARLTLDHLRATLENPDHSLVRVYIVTGLFALVVNLLSLAVSAPAHSSLAGGGGTMTKLPNAVPVVLFEPIRILYAVPEVTEAVASDSLVPHAPPPSTHESCVSDPHAHE